VQTLEQLGRGGRPRHVTTLGTAVEVGRCSTKALVALSAGKDSLKAPAATSRGSQESMVGARVFEALETRKNYNYSRMKCVSRNTELPTNKKGELTEKRAGDNGEIRRLTLGSAICLNALTSRRNRRGDRGEEKQNNMN